MVIKLRVLIIADAQAVCSCWDVKQMGEDSVAGANVVGVRTSCYRQLSGQIEMHSR